MTARGTPSPVAGHELSITRVFDAPVSLVFEIWSDAEHMRHWLAPKTFTCTHVDLDFRPGGAWRACIESDVDGKFWMGGRYREIERDRRIVYTFTWEHNPGQAGVDNLVTVSFAARDDGKTVQTFHQAPFVRIENRDDHVVGWTESFDREQAYLERLAQEESR